MVELDIEALVREAYEIVGAQMAAGREPDGDMREGAEQATLLSCGEWTAMDEAGNYGFGTWRPETSSGEETSDGAPTLHTPALEAPAVGPSAGVRPRATDSKAARRATETTVRRPWKRRRQA